MGVRAATLYDPATAVAKSTAALLAMTALDTTNLRLTFTVPVSGRVLVRMQTVVAGGTVYPMILLGVMEGATIRGRQAPIGAPLGTALATTFQSLEAMFVVPGLTAGASLTWDAAYSVDVVAASSNLRYGGPNDATTTNAWGGFAFEIWDA